MPGFGQDDRALLLVDLVVGLVELGDVGVDGVVELGAVVERAGDDQRRARLVDQDRVDLVHDGEDVPALDHVLHAVLHVVAQIVEAELVVGAVGDVAVVGLLALLVVEAVHDDADREAEEIVDLAHPLGVALGQVVVDGDDVDAAPGQRVEIDRQRRDQRLAFAGLHLGDPALVQDHAADELHVEMALAERALGGLAAGREGRNQDVVERLAFGDLLLEVLGAGAQRLVGQLLKLLLQRVDLVHARLIALDAPLVGGAEQLAGERADHPKRPFAGGRAANLADFACAGTLAANLCQCSSRWRLRTVISGSRYEMPRPYLSFGRAISGLWPERPAFPDR